MGSFQVLGSRWARPVLVRSAFGGMSARTLATSPQRGCNAKGEAEDASVGQGRRLDP